MDEIVELIGIIEGVNYDEIINELEILKLQEWVKRNQSLRYHGVFSDILIKLDEILEDNFISEEEKTFLISFAKENYNESRSVNDSLNVLNGIIEGIVCDNVINDQEIFCLYNWLKSNTNLKGVKVYENIFRIIMEILKDNIITKEEQKSLLELLSNTILDSKSNLKIEYLKKMVLNHQNIGMNLIELIDNESIIKKIHESAQGQLSKVLYSYSGAASIDNELVFISLVLIGLMTYDGSFYANVEDVYSNLYEHFSSQKIEGQIRSIISRFKTDKSNKQSRIISTVLINAIVPQHFLPDFFEFIYDIYKLNFDYVLDKNVYDDFKFIYEGISDSLNPDNDEIHFNTTKKVYKLIRSTKQLILNETNFDSIIKLSISAIKLIDKIYWEEKDINIINPYLKEGYQNWIKTYYNNKIQKHTSGQSKNLFRSRWKPSVELNGRDIYLIPPIHKIKSTYDYSSFKIIVENDKKIIYENTSPYIQEIFGGYQINSQKILIDDPLSRISYKVYADGQIFYESHRELFREVLVFNREGKELSNNTNYVGDAIFCFKQENAPIKSYYQNAFYQLGIKKVDMNTVLVFGQTAFNFSATMNPGIIGDIYNDTFIRNNQIQIPIYKKADYLVFESKYPMSSLGIRVNQNNIELIDCSCSIVQRGTLFKYVVKLPEMSTGIYRIQIINLVDEKIIENTDFIITIDQNFTYSLTKLDDNNYFIDLKSTLIEEPISKQISVNAFSEFNLSFFYENTRFNFQLPLKIPMYQLDDSAWHPLSDALWIDDVKHESQIRFYGIDCIENEIRLVNKNTLLDIVQLKKVGYYYELPIGFIKTYKMNYDYVNLIWINKEKQMDGLLCLNYCKLNDEYTNIEYDPVLHLLNANICFLGKGNVGLSVLNEDNIECFNVNQIENNQSIAIHDIEPFTKYTIIIYEKSLGFSLNKMRVIKKIEKEFYSYSGLSGRSFKIGDVIFDQFIRGRFLRKTHILKNTYVRFDKMENDYKFIGNLYRKVKNNKNCYLYKVNPVEIEITGDINSRHCEIAITKDKDGLLLDFNKHTICNTMDDPKATDIFSYTINLREWKRND